MRVQKLVDRYEAQYQKKRDRKVCHCTHKQCIGVLVSIYTPHAVVTAIQLL